MNLYGYIEIISAGIMSIPLLILILCRKSISLDLAPIAILLIISIFTELINFAFVFNGKNNFLILRIYTVFEVFLLLSFYFLFFKRPNKIPIYLLLFVVFIVIEYIDLEINGLSSFDNFSTSYESLLFSSLAIWSFIYLIKQSLYKEPVKTPFFWTNTAILLYFGGNFILFVFNNYLLQHKSSGHLAMWVIHSFLNISYYCLIAIAFWKTRRP